MKRSIAMIIAVFAALSPAMAEEEEKTPTIQDLDFLVGSWEEEAKVFSTRNEGEFLWDSISSIDCVYDLPYRRWEETEPTPIYITCHRKSVGKRGDETRYRETRESIRYNRFKGDFEQVGLYSNWPTPGYETVTFDPETRTLKITGVLDVGDRGAERYEALLVYNKDFDAYEYEIYSNFSDMPSVRKFFLIWTAKGRKVR